MSRRLSLLAGHGQLVRQGADAALASDWRVQIINLVGREDIGHLDSVAASPTNPVAIWMALRKFRPTHICMIGAVRLSDGDREGLAAFLRRKSKSGKSSSSGSGGDGAMAQLSRLLEFTTGAKVVGIHEIVDGLLAPVGHIAGPAPARDAIVEAAASMKLARSVGRLDAGQALVTAGARIIAIEDIAGTDALIDRVGEYRMQNMTGDGTDQLVLTKCRKPGQLSSVDLPAIGPETVEHCANAGIATIVVQSQHTLLISRESLIERANALGVTVIGIPADETSDG